MIRTVLPCYQLITKTGLESPVGGIVCATTSLIPWKVQLGGSETPIPGVSVPHRETGHPRCCPEPRLGRGCEGVAPPELLPPAPGAAEPPGPGSGGWSSRAGGDYISQHAAGGKEGPGRKGREGKRKGPGGKGRTG